MNNNQDNPQSMGQQPQMWQQEQIVQQPQMWQQEQIAQQPQMEQQEQMKHSIDNDKVSKIIAVIVGVLAITMMIIPQFTSVVKRDIDLGQLSNLHNLNNIIRTTPALWIGLVIAIVSIFTAIAGLVLQVGAKENKNTSLIIAFSLVIVFGVILMIQTFRVNSDIMSINSTASKIIETTIENHYSSRLQQELWSLGVDLANGINTAASTVSQYDKANTLFQISGVLTLVIAFINKIKKSNVKTSLK